MKVFLIVSSVFLAWGYAGIPSGAIGGDCDVVDLYWTRCEATWRREYWMGGGRMQKPAGGAAERTRPPKAMSVLSVLQTDSLVPSQNAEIPTLSSSSRVSTS